MTDLELLKAAAKAAGIEINQARQGEREAAGFGDLGLWTLHATNWNPLADGDDALRLAVKLELDIAFMNGDTLVLDACYGGPDKMYNTCRAIVHAAANIGKAQG